MNQLLSQGAKAPLRSLQGRNQQSLQLPERALPASAEPSNHGTSCLEQPRGSRGPRELPRLCDVQAANTSLLRARLSPLLCARLLPRLKRSHTHVLAQRDVAGSPGTHKGKAARQGLSAPCNKHLCSGMLQKPITSCHITSFISYTRMVYFPMSTLALSIKSPPSPLFLYPSHLTL